MISVPYTPQSASSRIFENLGLKPNTENSRHYSLSPKHKPLYLYLSLSLSIYIYIYIYIYLSI